MKEERTANITEAIKSYFADHPELFADCIEELDDYDCYLFGARRHDMDDFDTYFSFVSPIGILQMAHNGRDADFKGDFAKFDINRNYFYFNAYGNLVSTDYRDYSVYLDDDAIRTMCNNIDHIDSVYTDPELFALFADLQKVIQAADTAHTEAA